MKTIRMLALSAAAFVLLFASGAQAQEKFGPMYFGMSFGGYAPAGTDLDDADAKTGFVGLVNGGYMFSPFFGLQTDLGYLETSGNNNLQVSAIPVAVSFKFGIPIAFFEPYAIGGAGVYFTSTEYDLGAISTNDNSVELGVHAGGGVNFNFGGFQIGAEARYLWLEANNLNVDGLLVMGKIGSRF